MNSVFDIICTLSKIPAVSGKESHFSTLVPGIQSDDVGNVWWMIEGKSKNPKTILIEAHRDEIGLCISKITKEGFFCVKPCGGIDVSTLPGSTFTIVGRRDVLAVATSIPPHLKNQTNSNHKLSFDDLYLDAGFSSKKEAEKVISIGDIAYAASHPKRLSGSNITARSLDNKASVASLILASQMTRNPENNILFLLSVGEETTSCGVRLFCRKTCPDFALVVDAGFAMSPGLDKSRCIKPNAGPAISVTDTLSIDAVCWVQKKAEENNLPLQVVAEPGGTGTSATAIQTENKGIPSAVISIPVFNMHTQSEIVSEKDILATSKLLSVLASSTDFARNEVILLG